MKQFNGIPTLGTLQNIADCIVLYCIANVACTINCGTFGQSKHMHFHGTDTVHAQWSTCDFAAENSALLQQCTVNDIKIKNTHCIYFLQ